MLIERAKTFATNAHRAIDHKRKYTFEDYIVHPAEVANIAASVGVSDEAIAAAWLHDVVEDTPVTIEEIRDEFGDRVATIVAGLTNVATGNRAARKALERHAAARQDSETQTVKAADIISNLPSIIEHDPEFAKVYVKERKALLGVLTKAHPILLGKAWKILDAYVADHA